MGRRRLFLALLTWATYSSSRGDERNLSPLFQQDMNNFALSESTPVGALVYTLKGEDPEGMPIAYGLVGTDRFSVDADSGDVTLVRPLDREVNDTLKFLVSIEEKAEDGTTATNGNKVQLPVSVIILDENDNAPTFQNSPFEASVREDAAGGATVLADIAVHDRDSVGDSLELGCVPNPQWADACEVFEVVTLLSSQSEYSGALILRGALDYSRRQFYQFTLVATDGTLNSSTSVEVKVVDVQNLPPVFSGSLAAALSEDAPIGSLALTVQARDGDRADPRPVSLDLLTNPLDFFLLDSSTGELKTAKPLDREALADPSSPLNLTVRAREIVNGQPLSSNSTSATATITITIRDVNDEPPRFNRAEYSVSIPENFPLGSPLPNLDMLVTDTDVGLNSAFSLRLSDVSGAFTVEPETATGSARVSVRLNNTQLDYEEPDQRKFIIVVIAEELHTSPRLSSKATLVVSVTDVNDNAPVFRDEAYWATVSEAAAPGAHVLTITATDRDQARYGSEGIVYQLFGSGAELFTVDNRTGVISVAACASPGRAPCLDLETRRDYFLSYKATDDDGSGQSSVVSLKVSLSDANDNSPTFAAPLYRATIDEDATKFEPELQVQARDADETSEVRYSLIDVEPAASQFWIDSASGKLGVRSPLSSTSGTALLTVLATDGVHNATNQVEVTIRDVNNHAPVFSAAHYNASVSEDVPIGTEIATVNATDMDSGPNAELKYSIQKGALDAFSVDNASGLVTVASKLDYDKRNTYRIQIVATDQGIPSQTGTTELIVTIINANDKKPYFTPQTQRAEVSADAEIGTLVHTLIAMDPDIVNNEDLKFELSEERPLKVVDSSGKEVVEASEFRRWFAVGADGAVRVATPPERSRAAVLALPVAVTDTTAPQLQRADGELIITIVDVNRHAPVFPQSHYTERVPEEQPPNTLLGVYTASDRDSALSHYAIVPPSPYFQINNLTGAVRSTQRIDYERVRRIDFTVVAYDAGAPPLSGAATVTVDVDNVNDEPPRFDSDGYEATVLENAKEGTPVLTVHATDDDEGQFGEVRYEVSGEHAGKFSMDATRGELTVARGADIDRERTHEFWLQAVAVDNAPTARHTASAPIHIKVLDANDNPPVFSQPLYNGTVAESLSLRPPAPILQVRAKDLDEGINAQLLYTITAQSVPGTFSVDPANGIISPALPVVGNTTYHLTVRATDRNGTGVHSDTARVYIHVTSVNRHSPVFTLPAEGVNSIEIPENAAQSDVLVMTVAARDADAWEDGRVSYYLRVGGANVHESDEFRLDETSGELRSKIFLDRESSASYPLVLVARDHGSPPLEVLHFLTVVLQDSNDNVPQFPKDLYEFSISENQPAGIIIGTIKAVDKDSGEHGKVYYHMVDGNEQGTFVLDRTQGILRANVSFDREKQSEYTLTVYASNEPVLERGAGAEALNSVEGAEGNDSAARGRERGVATVVVTVRDENDNEPRFERATYYAGVKYTAKPGAEVASVAARDDDAGGNGTLAYLVAASNIYRAGESVSSGSIVPSPFNITQSGTLLTASFMAEYNQERFVLDIIAQETEPPHRQAKTQVFVWVVSEEQVARVVVSRRCADAARERPKLEAQLSAATGSRIVAGAIERYVHSHRLYEDWCELHLHAADAATHEVVPVARLLASVDARYDQLRSLYRAVGIETLSPATGNKVEEKFDPALAALIALLIVLFTGLVTFVVVCACLKHWVISAPSMESSKGDSLARRRILDELSTTENPLWLENKLRPYEEQELTMNVFGEQDAAAAAAASAAPPSPHHPPPPHSDNTYATIQGGGGCGGGTEREYATLGAAAGPPTPLEAMLGFQGSTFQPPAPDTPEPPPRPSAGLLPAGLSPAW